MTSEIRHEPSGDEAPRLSSVGSVVGGGQVTVGGHIVGGDLVIESESEPRYIAEYCRLLVSLNDPSACRIVNLQMPGVPSHVTEDEIFVDRSVDRMLAHGVTEGGDFLTMQVDALAGLDTIKMSVPWSFRPMRVAEAVDQDGTLILTTSSGRGALGRAVIRHLARNAGGRTSRESPDDPIRIPVAVDLQHVTTRIQETDNVRTMIEETVYSVVSDSSLRGAIVNRIMSGRAVLVLCGVIDNALAVGRLQSWLERIEKDFPRWRSVAMLDDGATALLLDCRNQSRSHLRVQPFRREAMAEIFSLWVTALRRRGLVTPLMAPAEFVRAAEQWSSLSEWQSPDLLTIVIVYMLQHAHLCTHQTELLEWYGERVEERLLAELSNNTLIRRDTFSELVSEALNGPHALSKAGEGVSVGRMIDWLHRERGYSIAQATSVVGALERLRIIVAKEGNVFVEDHVYARTIAGKKPEIVPALLDRALLDFISNEDAAFLDAALEAMIKNDRGVGTSYLVSDYLQRYREASARGHRCSNVVIVLCGVATRMITRKLLSEQRGNALHGICTAALSEILSDQSLSDLNRIQVGSLLSELGDPRMGAGGDFPAFALIEPNAKAGELIAVSIVPVTQHQFAKFLQDASHLPVPMVLGETGWNLQARTPRLDSRNRPAIGISWHLANAYCTWLQSRLENDPGGLLGGKLVRLPTVREFEVLADWRRRARRAYRELAEGADIQARALAKSISSVIAVGLTEQPSAESPIEVGDQVLEWLSTAWGGWDPASSEFSDEYDATDGREDLGAEGLRMLGGSSWLFESSDVICACRLDPAASFPDVGFRIVIVR